MTFLQSVTHISASADVLYITNTISCHSTSLELWTVLQGTLSLSLSGAEILSNVEILPGECALLHPDTNLALSSPDSCILLRIFFPCEKFLHIFQNPAMLQQPFWHISDSDFYQCAIQYGHFLLSPGQDYAWKEASLLMPLICGLDSLITVSLPDSALTSLTVKQQSLLRQILEYVNVHYGEDITLGDTASFLSITPQYLASFFKQSMGSTFLPYVQEIRCKMARFYLTFTDLSPENICARTRLSNPRLLPASTKRMISSPAASKSGAPQQVSPKKALQYLAVHSGSDTAPAAPSQDFEKITARFHSASAFPSFWRQLINLGYASDFSNVMLSNQLIKVQKDIGFTYGRICRLLDLITEYSVNGRILYDYNRIFRILDVMIENQMMPFLEISNKLFRLQLSISQNVPLNLIKDTTEYFEHLLELLPSFTRACINRYGQECFDRWRFEISYNQYEFIESAEVFPLVKYIRYYQKIWAVIRTYSKHCQIGGPGFNHWHRPEMLLDILSLFRSYQILPDFVTAYVYPVTRDDSTSSLSEDENLTIWRIGTIRDILRQHYPNMELWITEFNSTMSARNLLNDSSYQAVFLAKNLTAAVDMNIQAMGYYLLSDVPLRYVDSFDLLFGGWGLFSDRDLPKPSYHTYCMFSRLGSYLLKQHKHYLITADSDCNFRCLFHHYEHIRPKYYRKNMEPEDLQSPESHFEALPDYHFEVDLKEARSGIYIVKEYTISESQSNLLTQWKNINFLTPARSYDLHALHLLSNITPRIFTLECTPEAPLSFSLTLEGHDIKMLLIDLNLSTKEIWHYE